MRTSSECRRQLFPSPSLLRAAGQAGFLERWDLGKLGGDISQPAQEQEPLAAPEGLPAPHQTGSRAGGERNARLFIHLFR